uniref:Uncharacterized protein n=1 Tax=Parascaris univalens TaxID=6257 RepID=A0A914ZMY0_PARUN
MEKWNISSLREDEARGGEWTPSGCYSPTGFGRPPVVCPQR